MLGTTDEEIVKASAVVRKYDSITNEDRTTLSAGELLNADAFGASRHVVASGEARLLELAKALCTPGVVYIPPGNHLNGRIQPYMNPLADTEQGAFGRELCLINEGFTGSALRELTREIAELNARKTYACNGKRALEMLAAAERATA